MNAIYILSIFLLNVDISWQKNINNDMSQKIIPSWAPRWNTTYCYDYVGCFSNNYPYNNTNGYLPVDPQLIGAEFLLYTNNNPNTEQSLTYRDPTTIRHSSFNRNLPLKVIVHGFSNDRMTPWPYMMKDAFLEAENVNVMLVFWGNGSIAPLYNNASSNIRVVAKELSLITKIIRETFFQGTESRLHVHCIGHSLGAHLCGYYGRKSEYPIDRITALDPANPFFEDLGNAEVRVNPKDAKFVDVIHTNAGYSFYGYLGMTIPTGHVDFYVNGGSFQPGCPLTTSIITDIFNNDPTTSYGCSHNRAIYFFIESIRTPCSFRAFKCQNKDKFTKGECFACGEQDCSVLGYYADRFEDARGSFFLSTADSHPFCSNQYLFELQINANSPKTTGEIWLNLEPTKAQPLLITDINTEFTSNSVVRRVFTSREKITHQKNVEIKFNKKPKSYLSFWFQDPNATKFIYDKLSLNNIGLDEKYGTCNEENEIHDATVVQTSVSSTCEAF